MSLSRMPAMPRRLCDSRLHALAHVHRRGRVLDTTKLTILLVVHIHKVVRHRLVHLLIGVGGRISRNARQLMAVETRRCRSGWYGEAVCFELLRFSLHLGFMHFGHGTGHTLSWDKRVWMVQRELHRCIIAYFR